MAKWWIIDWGWDIKLLIFHPFLHHNHSCDHRRLTWLNHQAPHYMVNSHRIQRQWYRWQKMVMKNEIRGLNFGDRDSFKIIFVIWIGLELQLELITWKFTWNHLDNFESLGNSLGNEASESNTRPNMLNRSSIIKTLLDWSSSNDLRSHF